MKDIYDMKLHDTITILDNNTSTICIIRVPGGWLYQTIVESELTTTFVPWHDSGRQIDSNGNYEELREKLKKNEHDLYFTEKALDIIHNENTKFIDRLQMVEKKLNAAEVIIKRVYVGINNNGADSDTLLTMKIVINHYLDGKNDHQT